MNKTKEKKLGKQFVGSGFVKTCDEQVINPHFIFILVRILFFSLSSFLSIPSKIII